MTFELTTGRPVAPLAVDLEFQLSDEEFDNSRSQTVTSRSPNSWGGRRYLPYAFTEQGVAMLSSVLRSKRAVLVNIDIMRAFVRLRQLASEHGELGSQLFGLRSIGFGGK